MQAPARHVAAARRNEALVDVLLTLQDPPHDWIVTLVYYAAVHYGRAFVLANGARATTSHRAFDSQFVGCGGDEPSWGHYRTLKDTSESARYDCSEFDQDDVEQMRNQHLVPFREFCLRDGKLKGILTRSPR